MKIEFIYTCQHAHGTTYRSVKSTFTVAPPHYFNMPLTELFAHYNLPLAQNIEYQDDDIIIVYSGPGKPEFPPSYYMYSDIIMSIL